MMDLTKQTRANWLKSLDWAQGEHIITIGQTGTGKTSLARQLLMKRAYAVVVASKKHDDSLERYKRDYRLIRRWPPDYGDHKVLLWPRAGDLEDIDSQRKPILHALNSIYKTGGWAVYLDEMGYASHILDLKRAIVVLLNQGRSSGISVIGSLTRPASATANTPLEAFSQVRHVFLFQTQDEHEHKRMAEIAGVPLRDMTLYLSRLKKFEFLAVSHGVPVHVGA